MHTSDEYCAKETCECGKIAPETAPVVGNMVGKSTGSIFNKKKPFHIVVFDSGDLPCGIMPVWYKVECPFNREDMEQKDLNEWKFAVVRMFTPYANGAVKAFYSDEDLAI